MEWRQPEKPATADETDQTRSPPIQEELIVASDRIWSYGTDTGRVWLDRIPDYLAIIDGEMTGHS
ncbi:MAG: hypothetical protein AAGG48_22870 [Planctomycetota bacterium]